VYIEIIANIGENSGFYILCSNYREVILRSRSREKNENKIENKKRKEYTENILLKIGPILKVKKKT
jgi:hypothetical protein